MVAAMMTAGSKRFKATSVKAIRLPVFYEEFNDCLIRLGSPGRQMGFERGMNATWICRNYAAS